MDNTICIDCGSKGSGTQPDFGFAFDNSKFSDAILMIEVVPDLPELKTGNEDPGVSVVVDLARKRKCRREEINTRPNGADLVMQRGEKKLNCNVLEMDDGLADEEREKEAVGRLEESSSGIVMVTNLPGDDEASENDNSSTNIDSSNSLHMRIVHISSPILAAKSILL